MSKRLPQANLFSGKYTDSQLIARAQQVHDGITADTLSLFTTPPVTMINLQSQIDFYTAACAAAVKGSKLQTSNKNNAKLTLLLQLKELSIYVSQIAQSLVPNGSGDQSILVAAQAILSSGFLVSFNPRPVDPISGLPTPIIRKAISETAGTLKILVRQYTNANRNTLLYQVQYRTSAIPGNIPVPAGPWQTQTFTGQNEILLTGLTSGIRYDWQIASVGGRDIKRNENPPINFTPVASVVII